MEELTLARVSELSNGCLTEGCSPDLTVRGISTDTRNVRVGDLFVALRGDHFNGHDFIDEAAEKGIAAAMVEKAEVEDRALSVPMIMVDDTLEGLQSLARSYRNMLGTQTVAVAGSNGKTGTKEMVAAILGQEFSVLKNEGNLNNHIGVPLSLLRLEPSHKVGVLEVGTNHPGELIRLLEMVQPVAGIITVIAEEHLEFFGDLEGVAREEGALASVIPGEGLLVLNADDEWSANIASRCKGKVVWFGFSEKADYRVLDVCLELTGTRFRLKTPRGEREIFLQLLGRHQVANAAAAVAVGEFFGLDFDGICRGLESITPSRMRMEKYMTSTGVVVINDAYNANPGSMMAALETVRDLPVKGRRFAVLGEMRELGVASDGAHQLVGKKVAECNFDSLVVVGDCANGIVGGAREHGMEASRIHFFLDPRDAAGFLEQEIHADDVVLVKASRGAALERVLETWMGGDMKNGGVHS